MKIEFAKVQASGNDFIILDNRGKRLEEKIGDLGEFSRFATRRKFSVGADGVLVLEDSERADFKMRIFNPDGSEVSMCGNGIRSSALYAYVKKWCGPAMKIETLAGILEAAMKDDAATVKMTPPRNIRLKQNIGIGNTFMDVHSVDTGVPHAVHFVESLTNYPIKEIGRKVRSHRLFEPDGTNVDFVEVIDNSTISVRTYERGVEDETLACGTGVVASAIISHLVRGTKQPVSATTSGEDILRIHFHREINIFKDVTLEGKAHVVFEGSLDYV
mgnify:CR=1 FL=1